LPVPEVTEWGSTESGGLKARLIYLRCQSLVGHHS
jgi:hypothetical protein